MSVDALVKQIADLTLEQRAELLNRLDDLYCEAGSDESIELSDEMKAMLDERDRAYEADPTNLLTWDQVMESLRQRK